MHAGWLSAEGIISIICRGVYYYRFHIITAVRGDACCRGSETRLRPAAFDAQIARRSSVAFGVRLIKGIVEFA